MTYADDDLCHCGLEMNKHTILDNHSPVLMPRTPPEPHWKTIMAGNIVVASGYCWCGDPDAKTHKIGIRP